MAARRYPLEGLSVSDTATRPTCDTIRPVLTKPPISCAICLTTHSKHTPAITLIHGYAVCTTHIDLVSQPEFDIITLTGKETRPLNHHLHRPT